VAHFWCRRWLSFRCRLTTVDEAASATARSSGSGQGGAITVDTGSLNLYGGSKFFSQATSSGNAGSINLNTSTPRDLAITFSADSRINASTDLTSAGGGKGGDISIGSANKILSIYGPGFISAETKGSGRAGEIELLGYSINLEQGAQLNSSSSGSGQGSSINLTTGSLQLGSNSKISSSAAFRIALQRTPSDAERDDLVRYAMQHGLANACRLVLNLNEFVFVD
jgi:hypothetical protein